MHASPTASHPDPDQHPTAASPATHPAGAGWLARLAPPALVVAAATLFAVLKLYAIESVVIGDEHLYFNMALLVNRGLVPYRDFFYTHPPAALYEAALAFGLFGYSLALGKAMTAAAFLVGGLVAYPLGRRWLGAAEGALACALLLLAFDPLRISSHFTGANEAFALAMIGLWLGTLGAPVLAGIAFGLGALVAVYVLPGAGAVALLLWGRSRGAALRFVAATVAVAIGGNLAMLWLAGPEFLYQVYVTQLQKGPEGSLRGYLLYHRLGMICFENRLLTAGSVAGLALLVLDLWRRQSEQPRSPRGRGAAWARLWSDPRDQGLLTMVAWLALFWTFYLLISKHHAYYFLFLMPVFAWLSATAYVRIARAALEGLGSVAAAGRSALGAGRSSSVGRDALAAGRTTGAAAASAMARATGARPTPGETPRSAAPAGSHGSRAARRRAARSGVHGSGGGRGAWRGRARLGSGWLTTEGAAPALLAVTLILATVGVVDALYLPFARNRYGTATTTHDWQPLRRWPGLDRLVAWAFWDPAYSLASPPSGITRYLQHESLQMTKAAELYRAVEQHSQPGDAIFGPVGLIPLVASETGRRVAADLVDTSSYRITFGLSRIEDWIAAIEADHVELLVARSNQAPMSYPAFAAWARDGFATVATVQDPQLGRFDVMRRIARRDG